jgi:hypothetical protein
VGLSVKFIAYMNSEDKIYYKFFAPFIVFLLGFVFWLCYKTGCHWQRHMMRLEINGVVTSKYLDSTNHMEPAICIKGLVDSSENVVGLTGEKSNFYNTVNINDTLFKKAKSLEVLIRSRGTIHVSILKFDCD